MSYSLNSLKGVIWGIMTIIGVIKGKTRSLDNGSYRLQGDYQLYGWGFRA